jgi:K+-sensing histidine kinase KdpD
MADAETSPDAPDAPDLRRLLHDLRNPLMIVDGMASLLERSGESLSPEQRADYAARIRAAADEMRRVIDGLGA